MTANILQQLEQKIDYAVEVIQLLRLQIEELEETNIALKAEREKWHHDLMALIKRLEDMEPHEHAAAPLPRITIKPLPTEA